MRGLFEVAGSVHTMTRIAQAAQHHRLQDGIIFNEQNSHAFKKTGFRATGLGCVVRNWSGSIDDKVGMSIRHNLRLSRLRAASHHSLRTAVAATWTAFIVTALSLSQGQAMAQTPTETLGLTRVLEAARNNFDVAITRQAAEAAKADVLAADRAPFPIFNAKTSQMYLDSGVNGNQGIGPGPFGQKNIDKSGGIDWTWERGSKRALRTQSAGRLANAAQADLQDMVQVQQAGAASAYFDLLAARERNREMHALANSALMLAKSAGLRLKAGDLSAQDTARLEIEAQRAQADAHSAQLDQQRALLLLGQLTALRVDPTRWHIAAEWPALPTAPLSSNVPETWVEQRPDVKAALERVAAAQASLDLAMSQKKADVTVGSSLDHDPRVSRRSLELRFSVPLQWGYGFEGEIGRAQAQLTQAQDVAEKTKQDARAELQRLLEELRTAVQRETLYAQDIMPRARRVAEQAEVAYTKGASSLTDLIDARRTLRNTLIEATLARTDFAKSSVVWDLRTANISR
ncbi:TolC Outer membrane protein [Burkholderiaceae bacterium]